MGAGETAQGNGHWRHKHEGLSLESQHLPVTPALEGDPWGFLSCQSGVGQQEQTQLYQD